MKKLVALYFGLFFAISGSLLTYVILDKDSKKIMLQKRRIK